MRPGKASPQEILSRVLGFSVQTDRLTSDTLACPCYVEKKVKTQKLSLLRENHGTWLNYMALSSQKHGLASGEQREMVRNTSDSFKALTFILSMEASILNCCTVLRAWAMLLVLAVLLDIFS